MNPGTSLFLVGLILVFVPPIAFFGHVVRCYGSFWYADLHRALDEWVADMGRSTRFVLDVSFYSGLTLIPVGLCVAFLEIAP